LAKDFHLSVSLFLHALLLILDFFYARRRRRRKQKGERKQRIQKLGEKVGD